jgi:uncharacterized protein YndB with AHSA1/START domain
MTSLSGYALCVAIVEHVIPAPPERVWEILRDGWTYSDWVVGTAHVRDVDPDWPAPGARLHHKAGPWPVSVKDTSTVVSSEQPRSLVLRVGLWPLGEAVVTMTLTPDGPAATRVTMAEQFTDGPLLGLRNKASDLVLHRRNKEALRRLADLAVRRKAVTDRA